MGSNAAAVPALKQGTSQIGCMTAEHMLSSYSCCLLVQVKGNITYNGRTFKEFVPVRTASYITQYDVHMAELTVRPVTAALCRVC